MEARHGKKFTANLAVPAHNCDAPAACNGTNHRENHPWKAMVSIADIVFAHTYDFTRKGLITRSPIWVSLVNPWKSCFARRVSPYFTDPKKSWKASFHHCHGAQSASTRGSGEECSGTPFVYKPPIGYDKVGHRRSKRESGLDEKSPSDIEFNSYSFWDVW